MKFAKNETVAGGFLLVAIASTVAFLVVKAGAQGWSRGTKRFVIETQSGKNLREAAPVRMNGVQVGVVESIEMDPLSRIEVTFRVESRFARNVREDAVAKVIEPPVLGTTFVELAPGSPSRPELPSRGYLRSEDEPSLFANLEGSVADVKSIVSRVNVFVENATETMKEVRAISGEIARGKSVAGRAVNDADFGQDVATIVKNAAKASDDLAEATAAIRRREGAIGRLLKDDTLVREGEQLIAKTRESLATMDKLTAQLTAQLDKIATKLDGAGMSMDKLKEVVDNTAKLSAELATLARKVNQGQGTLGKLMNDDAIFVEAKGVLRELRESVQDLREQAPINSFIGVVFSAF